MTQSQAPMNQTQMNQTQGQPLPSRARVVVIGGGIIGASVAYHLTKLGWTDLVLLEQGHLSGGTTWHAAGLVGQLRATESGTRLVQYSAQLYSELEAETGLATGFKRCGGVTVARTAGPDGPAAAHRRHRRGLRPRLRADQPRPGARALPDPRDGRPRRRDLAAGRRHGQPDRRHPVAGPRRPRPRRPDRRGHPGHRHRPPRRRRHRRAHRRRRHRGRGRGQLRRAVGQGGRRCSRASTCRCTRPSTSTSSPSRSTACTATCRSCATRTATPTSRRRSAAWSSAASSPRPSRGSRPTGSRTRSSSSCSTRTGTTSRS